MASRKGGIEAERKNNFQERKAFSKIKPSHSSDGFFIKPVKSKKSNSSNKAANQKNEPAMQKELLLKKDKQSGFAQDTVESRTVSQPFDKKAWRFKRYSKKYKLEQWKDVRKTHILRGFDKTLNESNAKFNFAENYADHTKKTAQRKTNKEPSFVNDNDETVNNIETKPTNLKQNLVIHKKEVFSKQNQVEEQTKIEKSDSIKQKAARKEAIQEYKRKKLEKYKKLNRKTKKGQPVMKDRIELLLEQIQNSLGR